MCDCSVLIGAIIGGAIVGLIAGGIWIGIMELMERWRRRRSGCDG